MSNDPEAQAEWSAKWDAQLQREQELIAQCMRDAGFDYLPMPVLVPPTQLVQPNDRVWITQWGFGVVAGPDGINNNWFEIPPDPNEAIRSEFTPAELEAYHQALSGDWAGVIGVLPDDVPLENRGCRGFAQAQIQAEPVLFATELLQTDEWAPLQEALWAMSDKYARSDALRQAVHDWAMCMVDAGYPNFERQTQAASTIRDEFQRIPRLSDGSFAPIADTLIPELQEREIDLALADFDCRSSTDFDNRIREARHNIETQFVEDNRATLEAFRSAFEQQDN